MAQRSEVEVNQQALRTFEQQHQFALQYHEHDSHQELTQKDRLFDEMVVAQSKLEYEYQQLKARLVQQEHMARNINVGQSEVNSEMHRYEHNVTEFGNASTKTFSASLVLGLAGSLTTTSGRST